MLRLGFQVQSRMGKEDADTSLVCALKPLHLKKQRASLPSTPFILAAVDAVSPPGVIIDWNLRIFSSGYRVKSLRVWVLKPILRESGMGLFVSLALSAQADPVEGEEGRLCLSPLVCSNCDESLFKF